MAQPIDLTRPHRPINVGVVLSILSQRITEVGDVVPIDLLHGFSHHFANLIPDGFGPPGLKEAGVNFNFLWITETGEATPAKLTSGIRITPTHSFETCPSLDIVLVGAHQLGYTPNEAELDFVRKSYEGCAAFIAVCGGVDVPRLAGILEGKTATGPRPILGPWGQQSPGTNWVAKRWVQDGKMWTSGALFNGLDFMHNFIKQTWPANGLAQYAAKLGHWPDRDVDYKDIEWDF